MIESLTDEQLIKYISVRYGRASTLNKRISELYEANKSRWQGKSLLPNPRKGRSQASLNRDFDNMEATINFLVARISKSNVIPATKSEDSRKLANDLNQILVEKNNTKKTRKARKKMARNGFWSRLFILKIFWNKELEGGRGDWEIKNVDPRTIYIDPTATSSSEAEFIVEDVTCTFSKLLERFPQKEKEIREKLGKDGKNLDIDNPEVTYREAWLDYGNWVCYKFHGEILHKEKNPYWDWDGIPFSSEVDLSQYAGRRQADILKQEYGEDETDTQYFFNYFTNPRAPYIFSTILDSGDSPIGDSDYFTQTRELAKDADHTKRLLADNVDFVNGCTIVSGQATGLTEAQAERIDWSRGVLYISGGDTNGVRRETGEALPSQVFENLQHSERAAERVWGTLPVFRGESERQMTAIESRMLRDQSVMTKQEIVDVIEEIDQEMYDWEMQMMKAKYEEPHLVRYVGENDTVKDIEIAREDIENGINVRIVPGSIVPEDRVFKQQEAKEEVNMGLTDILTYYEAKGEENPREKAKQAMLFKLNPMAYAVQYLGMTPQELQMGVPQVTPEQFEKDVISQAEDIERNPDMSPEEKAQMITKLQEGMGGVQQ